MGPVQPLLKSTVSAWNLIGMDQDLQEYYVWRNGIKLLTEIKELSAGELSVQPVVLSMSETLKGKFTERLKGLYPPPFPASMAQYGLYSIPHDG